MQSADATAKHRAQYIFLALLELELELLELELELELELLEDGSAVGVVRGRFTP